MAAEADSMLSLRVIGNRPLPSIRTRPLIPDHKQMQSVIATISCSGRGRRSDILEAAKRDARCAAALFAPRGKVSRRNAHHLPGRPGRRPRRGEDQRSKRYDGRPRHRQVDYLMRGAVTALRSDPRSFNTACSGLLKTANRWPNFAHFPGRGSAHSVRRTCAAHRVQG